ncbi:unnamed protein product, partial [Effrenium voratum]
MQMVSVTLIGILASVATVRADAGHECSNEHSTGQLLLQTQMRSVGIVAALEEGNETEAHFPAQRASVPAPASQSQQSHSPRSPELRAVQAVQPDEFQITYGAQVKAVAILATPLCLAAFVMLLSYLWLAKENLLPARPRQAPLGGLGPVKSFLTASSLIGQKPKPQDTKQVKEVEEIKETSELYDSEPVQNVATPVRLLRHDIEHTGGEIVVEALRLAGVRRLFGIPGVQNLALYNAICSPPECLEGLDGTEQVAMHLIGNEEAAGYMAWGVWHQERRLGCACVIGGPGVTHALAGIACAFRDRTPMLVLTAGVRAGAERFQLHDVDNLAVLRPVCKALFRPSSVEDIGKAIREACVAALEGRPGPVGVEIACDLYNKMGNFVWEDVTMPTPELPAPTRLVPAIQDEMVDDPIVVFIRFLTSEAAKQGLECCVVAEPGRCARLAAAVGCASVAPGCGARPSAYAAESPGAALPAAVAMARGQADRQDPRRGNVDRRGLVIALMEDMALVPQGLELSHAHGLPLLLVTLSSSGVDGQGMARSMGIAAYEMATPTHSQNHTNAILALQGAASCQTSLLTVQAAGADASKCLFDVQMPATLPAACNSLVSALAGSGVQLLCSAAANPAHKRMLQALQDAAQGRDVTVVSCTDAQSVGFIADGAGRCFISKNTAVGACLLDSLDAFSLPTLSGVGEAWQDGVPLLLIVLSTQPENEGGLGPLTEFSKKLLVAGEESSWEEQAHAAASLAAAAPSGPVVLLLPRQRFLGALRQARQDGPRGPSLVATPFQPEVPRVLKAAPVPMESPWSPASGAEQALRLLLAAKRPWIHVGMGCATEEAGGDRGLVQQLAELLEAPVSSTFSGKGVLREDHPLWLWPIAGPAMPLPLREVADSCDAVIILGAQMGEIASCRRQWPARRMKVVHVDADPCVLGANFAPDVAVLGDVVEVLRLLLGLLQQQGLAPNRRASAAGDLHDPELRAELRRGHELLRAQMRAEAQQLPMQHQCSPFGLYGALQEAVPPEEAVFVADSGNGTVLSAEFLRLAGFRRFLAPTDFSSMGYCVPAAIGAALAARAKGKRVVSVATVGDGAFLMTGMEMVTALAMQLPVICVILRDGELGMISGLQRAQQNEVYCTHVPELMDMAALGTSMGLPSRRVSSDKEAQEVAEWAYAHCSSGKGPVLIEAMVSYAAPSFYARGATGQEPSAQVALLPVEPLPLTQLPLPPSTRLDEEARAFAKTALDSCRRSGVWDISECLRAAVLAAPEVDGAVQDGESSWSYAELASRVFHLRQKLLELGVSRGQRVGVMMPNSAQHLVAHFAITSPKLRAVVLNLSPRLQPPELLRLLEDAQPVAMICHQDSALLLAATVESCGKRWPMLWSGGVPSEFPGGVCLEEVIKKPQVKWTPETEGSEVSEMFCEMYFTSGTSGRSKGVLLSHHIVQAHALHCISEHRFTQADVWLHVAPMFHLVDAFAMFSVTLVCGRHVLLPGAFDAEKTLEVLATKNITATNMATSMVNLLLAAPASRSLDGRFPCLRLVSCGGAPLGHSALLRAQRLFGSEFFQSYGMTECCGKISMSMLSGSQRGAPLGRQMAMLCSSGKPFEGLEVRVADPETGEPVPWDGRTVGEVQIRGPTVFKGYLKPGEGKVQPDPEHFLPEGWFRTGDLATMSSLGFLQVIDRLKDMILVGSENVYCIEVENALTAHPAVALCSVYGVPGPEMIGELVKAVVLLKQGAPRPSLEEFQQFCGKLLADFKLPRIIDVVESLPLNSSGKVIKSELKKRDREAAAPEEAGEGDDAVSEHCYEVAWKSKFLSPSSGKPGSCGQWLVLSAGSDEVPVSPALLGAVSEHFRNYSAGGAVGTCSLGDVPCISDFGGLEAPAGICLLVPGADGEGDKVRMAVQRGLCCLMAVVRAAEARQIGSILLVAQHSKDAPVIEGQPLPRDPAVAACWAFVRAAAAESNISWRLVELCGHASPGDAAGAIVSEAEATCLSEPAERAEEVAWVQGRRYVPRLQQLEQVPELSKQLPRAGYIGAAGDASSCIIAGGNGSLGRLLVSCLAQCGQLKDLVIVGRKVGNKASFGAEVEKSSCNLQFFSADTGDLDSCKGLMKHVQTNAATCSHVLNLAGFLPESGMVPLAKDLRWSDCVPVLRPKVDGTLNLASACDAAFGAGKCAMVCFSSIFGVLSYPRLAPYGAANGFQDGFTEQRAARFPGSAQTVAWGAWAETGMAHRAGAGFHAFWASEGMGFVPPKQGMELLCRLLASKSCLPRQVCVFPAPGPGGSPWPAGLARHVLARDIALTDQAAEAVAVEGGAENLALDIRGVVVEVLGTLLGCEAEEVPMEEPFASAGVTSMMAVDLTSRVGKALSIALPATLAFEVVSAEQLCASLEARLKPKAKEE